MTKRTEIRLLNVKMLAIKDGGIVIRLQPKGNMSFVNEIEKMCKKEHWFCELYCQCNEKGDVIRFIININVNKYGDEMRIISSHNIPEYELLADVFGMEV